MIHTGVSSFKLNSTGIYPAKAPNKFQTASPAPTPRTSQHLKLIQSRKARTGPGLRAGPGRSCLGSKGGTGPAPHHEHPNQGRQKSRFSAEGTQVIVVNTGFSGSCAGVPTTSVLFRPDVPYSDRKIIPPAESRASSSSQRPYMDGPGLSSLAMSFLSAWRRWKNFQKDQLVLLLLGHYQQR